MAIALAAPFPPEALSYRVLQVASDGQRCLAAPMPAAWAILERLDAAAPGWSCSYEVSGPVVRCRLTIEGITREGVASGALPRAADEALAHASAHFGIGRYLWQGGASWVLYDATRGVPAEPPAPPVEPAAAPPAKEAPPAKSKPVRPKPPAPEPPPLEELPPEIDLEPLESPGPLPPEPAKPDPDQLIRQLIQEIQHLNPKAASLVDGVLQRYGGSYGHTVEEKREVYRDLQRIKRTLGRSTPQDL